MKEIKTIEDCVKAKLVVSGKFWHFLSKARVIYFDCRSGIKRQDDLSAVLENLATQFKEETGHLCRYNVNTGRLFFIIGSEKYTVSIDKLYSITHEE